jgi:hypothetical protein
VANLRDQESVDIDPDLDAKVNKMIAEGGAPLEVAEKIAAAARANAPVLSGAYRDGISAAKTPHGARVVASDEKSSWVEFGIPSQGQPAQFNLRRAVDAMGYKFSKGH